VDKAEYDELLRTIKKAYDDQTDPRWAASRGWVDRIIDPVKTRAELSFLLEAVSRPGPIPPFRVGALQT
jgi:acetyl-CoA carboxylase carboxyltransferase component